MRIRKRKVPLPLSLLSPIPITDPNLFNRSPVILVQPPPPAAAAAEDVISNSQPSDHLPSSDLSRLIDDGNSSTDRLPRRHDDFVIIPNNSDDPFLIKRVPHDLVGCLRFGGVDESMPKSNDYSNKCITTLGATTQVCSHNDGPSLPPNHEDRTVWCDEDKVMPLKKRSKIVIDEDKAKTINITTNNNNNNNTNTNINNNNNNAKKGGKRGSTIMEGSRCSRVNGRGWRCCQPTLVGYSLCEHHLGKGRLRSVSSVRGRPSTSTKKTVLGSSLSDDCSPLMRLCEAVKKESEVTTIGKRVKLGVVKARSLSSLLGHTNDSTSCDGGSRVGVGPKCD